MLKPHGSHICVISRNRPDLLTNTLNNIRSTFCQIRGIHLIISEDFIKNYHNIKLANNFKNSVISHVIRHVNNHGSLLNTMFSKLKAMNIRRVTIFWEGEAIIGHLSEMGWPPDTGCFLKINTNSSFYWQLRHFNLDYSWYFRDPYAQLPSLNVDNQFGLSISRLNGEYVVIDLLEGSKPCVANELFFNSPHYLYQRACHLLLKGEIRMAQEYFQKRTQQTLGPEVISRSYLGLAICHKIRGNKWESIKDNLAKAIKTDKLRSLEPIYFLLTWGLELKKPQDAYQVVKDNPQLDLYKIETPISGYLPYDETIYHYVVLYLFIKCCFTIHKYRDLVKPIGLLLSRDDIPTDIRQDLLYISNYSENYLKHQEEFNDNLLITADIEKVNIICDIIKSKHISYFNNLNTSDIYFKNSIITYNHKEEDDEFQTQLNINGLVFHKMPLVTDYLDDPDGNNQNNHDDPNEVTVATNTISTNKHDPNYYFSHEVFRLGSFGTIWGQTETASYLTIPKTPLFTWNLSYQVNNCFKIKKYDYQFAFLNHQSFSPTFLAQITPKYQLFREISEVVTKYKYVLYYGDNDISDLFNLLFLQLIGCYTIYHGNYQIYLILKDTFPDSLANVSGWSETEIGKLVNTTTDEINIRNQHSIASNYLIGPVLEKLLWSSDNLNPLFKTVMFEGATLPLMLENIPNTLRVTGNNRSENFRKVIDEKVFNWLLMLETGTLSFYQYILANLVISKLGHENGNIPDIIIIPILNNGTLIANFKISIQSKVWDFTPVQTFRDHSASAYLVKDIETLKKLEGSIHNPDLFLKLAKVVRVEV